ncbi:MAG: 50S ribosomal protein L29 [Patescibacteria group bacterium]
MLTKEEIKKAKQPELQKELDATRVEYAEIKLKVSIGQSKSSDQVKKQRKYAARLLTQMNTKSPEGKKGLEKESK